MNKHLKNQPSTPPPDRPDASMTLLRQIMERPRDGAYTEERVSELKNNRNWLQEFIVLILAIAIGTGGVWATKQLRTPVESASQAREVLEVQIEDRTEIGEGLREDIRELRAEIADLEGGGNPALQGIDQELIEVSEIHAGTSAVEGRGVEVEIAEQSQPSSDEEWVLDVDLQIVVNGLWASGAEAISINGRRLSFGTAIRTAGEVILVDLEPVQSPYVISVIGDPDSILRSFSETQAADHLRVLHSNYRIKSTITQVAHIEMKAGNALRIEYAEPLTNVNVSD